jgi:transposase
MEVEHDEQEIIQRVAALDIGKAELVCCVRVPGPGRRRMQEVRTFLTMTRSLLVLSDWLRSLGVTRVVMEATSDYWRPPFYLLEDSFETWLVNAGDVKHLPGRPKTDLLTELPVGSFALGVRLPIGVATFPVRDQRRGWVAGVVRSGGATARVA